MSSPVDEHGLPVEEVSVAGAKRKRCSIDSHGSNEAELSSILDSDLMVDNPGSPLSDVPDDLSDCSEAQMDVHLSPRTPGRDIETARTLLRTWKPEQSVQLQHHATQHIIQCKRRIQSSKTAKTNARRANSAKMSTASAPVEIPPMIKTAMRSKDRIATRLKTTKPPHSQTNNTRAQPHKPSKIVVLKFTIPSKTLVSRLPTPPSTPEIARNSVPASKYEKLHALAKRLVALNTSNAAKSDPTGTPEVWADGRQELCETLYYFRSHHSGSYTTGGFAKGFMFDKSAHCRDYIDSTVVISRAGGGLVQDKKAGQHVMSKDQRESSTVASLRNNMRYYNPVVIITGEDNPCMPSNAPSPYCVLDYFKPTHIWWEKTNGKKLLRYRFEKLNPRKASWWKPKDVEEPLQLGDVPPPITRECGRCKAESQQVYLNGWICLNPTCDGFWKLPDSNADPPEDQLLYDPRFLKQRTVWPNDEHNYSLRSNTVELSGLSIVGEDRSLACWLGMVCPNCGRCNSRLSWLGWECFNPNCTFKKTPPVTLIPAKALRDPYFPLTTEYTTSRDNHVPLVQVSISFAHNYRINKYTIPGVDGFIAHMVANKTVVEEPGGPDDMFEELQRIDIGLRRRSLGAGMTKGESYTRHFTVNYGMPYKFIAATASSSFEGAARAITDTRSRLNWASRFMVKEQHMEFNEVLALGYFEQQKINYHDDGEFGLGPTIGTLSLGAPGTMKLRMKARHYNGVSSAGVYDDAHPLPGCIAYEARLGLIDELKILKASDPKAYRARLKEVPKQLGLTGSGKAKDAVTLHLGHGDVAIMHGAGIQKYYEHAVEHAGKLRFALTCRYIDPESLKVEDRPTYDVAPDEGVYDGSKLRAAGSE